MRCGLQDFKPDYISEATAAADEVDLCHSPLICNALSARIGYMVSYVL